MKAYEPAVLSTEYLQVLTPVVTVLVATQGVPANKVKPAVFVSSCKPVKGVPVAIRFPYASFNVIVKVATSPVEYEALSHEASNELVAPLETVTVAVFDVIVAPAALVIFSEYVLDPLREFAGTSNVDNPYPRALV